MFSLCAISQVESLGWVGVLFGDLWWWSQDKEENLCEDLSDNSVQRTACWYTEVWEESMPRYVDTMLKTISFLILMSLSHLCVFFWQQLNVSVCAQRVVQLRTAVNVCVTTTCCTGKSTVWRVSLWQEPGWHWPANPRWSLLAQMPKVSLSLQESAPPARP